MQGNHFPFIIIGAGISGLQAAYNLAEMAQRFIVLEAQDRIGGRIRTLTIGEALKQDGVDFSQPWLQKVKDVAVEVGATWMCEDNTGMRHLIEKHQIDIFPQFYEGKHIMALTQKERVHLSDYSHYYRKHQDKIVPFLLKLTRLRDRYQRLVELKRADKINADQKDQLDQIYEVYDSMTAYDFIANQIKDPFLLNLLNNEVITLQGLDCRMFSAMTFILDDAGWDGIYYYLGFDSHNIDGFRANRGFKELCVAMKNHALRELRRNHMNHNESDIFRLRHPVTEILNDRSPVEIFTANGMKFTCDKVLLAVPLGTMKKIKFAQLSEGKRLLIENQMNSWCVRMTLIFEKPFWRQSGHSGNVNFSHEYHMNQLVQLSPKDLSCGIVALVFFKDGFLKWDEEINRKVAEGDPATRKKRKYEANKKECLKIMADLYLEGDIKHPSLQKCAIFTRSLSWEPYIRASYDSTTAPRVFHQLNTNGLNQEDPETCDEPNIIILGSDFCPEEDLPGYMQGGIRIANRKVNQCLLPKL